ncbi:uncharacterized protein LOC101848158 isoform X2 [Aplysia californica]|nr:uncharacterized protein LOC101848158 isoform X2 [Aplysia californica]
MSVLHAEIAALNQGESCEMEILPSTNKDDCDGEFECLALQRFNRCPKKSEHNQFVPILELRLEHLPISVRCPTVLKLIKDVAVITVRLIISYTSNDRPKRFRCGGGFRVGSGYVDRKGSVNQWRGSHVGTTFIIQTAAHVVFNNREAEKTTVEFFYEDDYDRSSVVRAKGVSVLLVNEKKDYCQLICQVENLHMGAKVMQRLSKDEDYSSDNSPMPSRIDLAFCISHPHGTAKKVSLGTTKLVKVKKPVFKSAVLKALLYGCCHMSGFDEKKVMYFYFTEIIKLEIGDFFSPTFVSEFALHKTAVLTRLQSKGLICRPTDTEQELIQREFDEQLLIYKVLMEAQFRRTYGSQTLSSADKEAKKIVILKEIVGNLESKLNAPDSVMEIHKNMFEEIMLVITEVMYGQQIPVNSCTTVESATYSVPTCSGSSGAQVNALVLNSSGFKFLSATHSFGGANLENRSGFGSFLST